MRRSRPDSGHEGDVVGKGIRWNDGNQTLCLQSPPSEIQQRGGNIDGQGHVSDFDIVTVDIVANPSALSAYPDVTLAESLGMNKHGREAMYLTDFVKQDPAAQRYFEQEITRFLTDVRDQYKWRQAR